MSNKHDMVFVNAIDGFFGDPKHQGLVDALGITGIGKTSFDGLNLNGFTLADSANAQLNPNKTLQPLKSEKDGLLFPK